MKRLALIVGGLFLMAESAFAIVDFQVLYNFRLMREAKETPEGVRSRPAPLGAKIAIHTNPIPVAPVALGITIMPISMFSADKDESSSFYNWKEREQLELGVELMAWLPMVPVVRPYMKVGFDFLGKKVETSLVDGQDPTELKYMTLNTAVGLKYALPMLPMLGFIVEGTLGAMRFYAADETLKTRIEALNDGKLPYFGGSAGVEVAI